MSTWGGGYVTDITYMAGWYRHQSPLIISIACLLGGVAAPMPAAEDAVSYLELGCGHGLGAMLLAASNPAWRVTAVDFNPAHIAAAREWAAETGLGNVTFIEGDLASLAEDTESRAIPEADFVSLHGLWTWVPEPVQAGIVRLLRTKVRPGGAVHVSYNSLPAWGSSLGMARLLREAGRRLAWRSDRQAEEGMKFLRDLHAAEAVQLRRSPMAQSVINRMDSLPIAYVAHEYMNEHWTPRFMADVAASMADAKLEWAGSAHLTENFPDLTLTVEQRALAEKFDEPLMRELVKDLCIDRGLRHDVFVRGRRQISTTERNAALMDLSIGLNIPPGDLPLQADMPAGQAQLNPGFYQPIAKALADGPRRVRDLLALPNLDGKRDNPAELVGVMVGLDLAEPSLRPGAVPGPEAIRFNQLTARRWMRSEPLGRPMAAASHRMGTAVQSTLLDQLVVDRVLEGEGDIDSLSSFLARVINDQDKLKEVLDTSLSSRLPVLRATGVF